MKCLDLFPQGPGLWTPSGLRVTELPHRVHSPQLTVGAPQSLAESRQIGHLDDYWQFGDPRNLR